MTIILVAISSRLINIIIISFSVQLHYNLYLYSFKQRKWQLNTYDYNKQILYEKKN